MGWLIIGGGIQGVHLAVRLLGEAGISADRLRIVDPYERLLARWVDCTAVTGMAHMRSPSVHHLDLDPWSLRRFAEEREDDHSVDHFAPPYDRPSLELFDAHCKLVLQKYDLESLHIQDRATACTLDCGGVRVRFASGREIEAQNLVLAIGASEQPEWPEWAPRGNARIRHVFEPGFEGWPTSSETVVVVGGGLSAAQVALRLADEDHVVHLVSRHGLREHQFDSDPGWLGPKYMRGFDREQDLGRRRDVITKARNRGSVPSDIRQSLRRAIDAKRIWWHKRVVTAMDIQGDGLQVRLGVSKSLAADRVLLATGFAAHRPGGSMIDELIASASLPCASCGYPIVDSSLRWHPGVYVTGPLAELVLGPVSRNISGARQAGDRIVAAARAANPA